MTATFTLNYMTRSQAEAVRDALRAAGFKASLFGRWNVNGGGVRVELTAGTEADARKVAFEAALAEAKSRDEAEQEAARMILDEPEKADELLARADARKRELAAEYVILDRFDTLRRRAGHDYGNGQRIRELRRLERELESRGVRPLSLTLNAAEGDRDLELTAGELRAAFDRVSRSKRARLEAEDYRRSTPATRRTRETWTRLAEETARAASRELADAELEAEAVAALSEVGAQTTSPNTLSVAQPGRSKIVERAEAARADVTESIARRLEAGELLADKSMSDRDFLAPLIAEKGGDA